ncbi:MAG: restriction endonuclease subunit S [Bacteroides sp.]|nr:restriction endonuclease subunit S [Bacteroides sp.]
MGEIFDIRTGKGITKADATLGGKYPIISGGQTPMGYYHNYNRTANTVTISRVGAYAGFVSHIFEDFYLNDKCFSIIPKLNNISIRFTYFYLKNNESMIKSLQSEGGVPTINTQKISNIKFPIPPLELQEKIVSILDRFETLVNDLNKGLPAEIAAVKEQYEYYRNKLLTFKQIV